MKVAIIGGGIIGLCSAYYLQQSGAEVEIIEMSDGKDGCSFGNAGYVAPSHFIPLATPGIVIQGLKWMLNPSSPFYIKPRLNWDLMQWGFKFWRKANKETVDANIPHLDNLLKYSRTKTIEISNELGNNFDLKTHGCYMMFRSEKTAKHEEEMAHKAKDLGIETIFYSGEDLQKLEPNLGIKSIGGVLYPIDAHLHPIKWMQAMKSYLSNKGVVIRYNDEVTTFELAGNKIKNVITKNGYQSNFDHIVICSGAWLPETLKKLSLKILLQPGKGYSTTYDDMPINLSRPAILVDDRVALTPLGNSLRIGGTMELSGNNHIIQVTRMNAIVNAVNNNFTNFNLQKPAIDKIWCGLRPVTPDGLPYIGNSKRYSNLSVAGGHAMLGISLAAGTGKIVADLINGRQAEIPIDAFDIHR